MTFENTIITKYWPAEEKNQDGEMIPQLVIQCEAELDNSMQVGYLFTSMVKGLMEITFTNSETGEAFVLQAATIKPFNVKQKKLKMGKGDDATVVMAEFAQMKIITLMDDEGKIMQDLYAYFNRNLVLAVEDIPAGKPFGVQAEDEPPAEQETSPDAVTDKGEM